MDDIILKIEATVNVVVPVVLLILGTAGLAGWVTEIEKWYPVVMEILGAALAVFKIWGGIARGRLKKRAQ